ncbi:MAG TPA: hypothetical protein VGF33_07710 [Caulobacteraceae bacterium]
MPMLRVSPAEAKRVQSTRKRNEARNRVLTEVVDRLKPRLKADDPLEVAITTAIISDIRKMVRT